MAETPYTLRLGTRASPLALAQAEEMAARLTHVSNGEIECRIVKFTTSGDKLTTERLINAGGKGLFTKELDRALADSEIDFAVHSLKDVPAVLPDGQTFICIPERSDAREGWLSATAETLADLPSGGVVGTASLRREAQTLRARPDINVSTFRGNVQTRLAKLERGEADATYLAMAGLTRLGNAGLAKPIPLDEMLPAPAQGIIGCTACAGSLPQAVLDAFKKIEHHETRQAAIAERAVLKALDGSCRTPIAAHLFRRDDQLNLVCEVIRPDGGETWRAQGGTDLDADDELLKQLGEDVGQTIRDAAGGNLPAFSDD